MGGSHLLDQIIFILPQNINEYRGTNIWQNTFTLMTEYVSLFQMRREEMTHVDYLKLHSVMLLL